MQNYQSSDMNETYTIKTTDKIIMVYWLQNAHLANQPYNKANP